MIETGRIETGMIEEAFDSRTLANMNVALERICERAANGEDHSVRERIARQIIMCASNGKTTLGELTAAGQRTLTRITVRSR
jgi:hypothetical protein